MTSTSLQTINHVGKRRHHDRPTDRCFNHNNLQ